MAARGLTGLPAPFSVERRCPGCGAGLRYTEADHGTACGFCGLHVAILRPPTGARYAIRARGDETSWTSAAKRAFRERGIRVRELLGPWVVQAPFFRLSATIHAWWREPADDALEFSELAHSGEGWTSWLGAGLQVYMSTSDAPADERRVRQENRREQAPTEHFRIGDWEQTLDATRAVDLGDQTLGVRSRVLEVTPIEELWDAERTHAAPCPARLGTDVPREEAASLLQQALEAARTPDVPHGESRSVVRRRPLQLVYHPYVIVEYRGPEGGGAIVLDGVTHRLRTLLDATQLEGLRRALESQPGDASAWVFPQSEEPLHALVCPHCTAPLDCPAGAQIFPCSLCERCYRFDEGRLAELASVGLHPRAPAGGAERRSAPFYRILVDPGANERQVFVPAAQARHPRMLWSLAAALSRKPQEWREDAPVKHLAASISVSPEEARELLPFLWSLAFEDVGLSDEAVRAARVDLVWITLARSGREWVGPGTRLGFSQSALGAWSTPRGSAAANTG